MSRPLLVATAGGHLTQLLLLAPRMDIDLSDALWVSMRTAQSVGALAGRNVVWTRYGAPRDVSTLASHLSVAARVVRRNKVDVAISTGANLAPPFLAVARSRGVASHFIDSATRVAAPSLAGRLAARIPGVRLYTQYPAQASARWNFRGNVFDGFRVQPSGAVGAPRRAVVSVGSAKGFGFDALIKAAQRVLPANCETVWQVGASNVSDLVGEVVSDLPDNEMRERIANADVVICHAGTGSALTALQLGKLPILVPRRPEDGEHVDDHQHQIAASLAAQGLAVVRTTESLDEAALAQAASVRVLCDEPAPFALVS